MKGAPIFRQLQGLKDLARLACAFERIPRPLFAIPSMDGRYALSVHAEQLGDSPIFFYSKVETLKPYVRYKLNGDSEEASFVDEAALTQYLHAPVLTVKSAPPSFIAAIKDGSKVTPNVQRMELSDVNSLLKIGAYRYILDESYAPVYLSGEANDLVLGTFVHLGDFEGSDFFFFIKLEKDQGLPFIKFDPSKPSDWAFTTRTSEHGYYYAKVIRLVEDSF